jgi:hypothetical protein
VNQYNDACCGPNEPDNRRHYSHYNAYHQVCCHASGKGNNYYQLPDGTLNGATLNDVRGENITTPQGI